MPPTGYLSSVGIEACLQYLSATYPGICQLITLPEPSVEGRTIRAIKLGTGAGGHRHGLLLIGGAHARELVPPDALVTLALRLCQAYAGGTGLTYGARSYSAGMIKFLIESLDLFMLPLVNPDGRAFVQSPAGDPWWRKNRRPNPGCLGVDLNRNYDFLWSSGIGTSSSWCSDVFKGPSVFSEPETRNVKWMLDTYSNVECYVDVHSYSELFLYPWGDDDNQSTTASMNFMNPAYNGLRGTSGDSQYREYFPAADESWFINSGDKVRQAILDVRGHDYLVEQGIGLYPTSGTSEDYAYARHFVDGSVARVYGYTLETGLEFQPPYGEALQVIAEASSGLIQFAIQCICTVEATAMTLDHEVRLDELRKWKLRLDESPAGRRYLELLPAVSGPFLRLLADDRRVQEEAGDLLERMLKAVEADSSAPQLDDDLVARAARLLERTAKEADRDGRAALEELVGDLGHFRGRTLPEGLERASERLSEGTSPGKRRHRRSRH
jgi:murein tripeptide amidase MpaA